MAFREPGLAQESRSGLEVKDRVQPDRFLEHLPHHVSMFQVDGEGILFDGPRCLLEVLRLNHVDEHGAVCTLEEVAHLVPDSLVGEGLEDLVSPRGEFVIRL